MTSQLNTWSYLIRFVSAEDIKTYFGDAILPPGATGLHDIDEPLSLKARIITGNPFQLGYTIAEASTPVKKLLGPLTRDLVPDIRCIGGNYATHCTLSAPARELEPKWRTSPTN